MKNILAEMALWGIKVCSCGFEVPAIWNLLCCWRQCESGDAIVPSMWQKRSKDNKREMKSGKGDSGGDQTKTRNCWNCGQTCHGSL